MTKTKTVSVDKAPAGAKKAKAPKKDKKEKVPGGTKKAKAPAGTKVAVKKPGKAQVVAKMSPVDAEKTKKRISQVRHVNRGPLYGTVKAFVAGKFGARVHTDASGILDSLASDFITRSMDGATVLLRANPKRKTLSRKDMRYSLVKLLNEADMNTQAAVLDAEAEAVSKFARYGSEN